MSTSTQFPNKIGTTSQVDELMGHYMEQVCKVHDLKALSHVLGALARCAAYVAKVAADEHAMGFEEIAAADWFASEWGRLHPDVKSWLHANCGYDLG